MDGGPACVTGKGRPADFPGPQAVGKALHIPELLQYANCCLQHPLSARVLHKICNAEMEKVSLTMVSLDQSIIYGKVSSGQGRPRL